MALRKRAKWIDVPEISVRCEICGKEFCDQVTEDGMYVKSAGQRLSGHMNLRHRNKEREPKKIPLDPKKAIEKMAIDEGYMYKDEEDNLYE